MKLKFWQFSEEQVSRKIERNLTVRPIELIKTVIEVSTPSLSPEDINKETVFRKLFTQKKGGGTLKIWHKYQQHNFYSSKQRHIMLSTLHFNPKYPFLRMLTDGQEPLSYQVQQLHYHQIQPSITIIMK